ncbi:MAG: hypothetical protein WBC51_05000 [Vicinamibacterales bacterium]
MRRLHVRAVLVLLSLLIPISAGLAARQAAARAPVPTDTVYVTRTGAKYHAAGCRSLSRSRIATTLGEASKRYGACRICKPPVLSTGAAPATAAAAPRESPRPAARSARCAAITKKGTQCSRNAKPGSAYCWQHGG